MATPVTTAVPAAPLCERRDADGVASLTFNRPQQYNALSLALLEELESAIDAIAGEPAVRVVVVAGAGKAFCAGHDLKELRAHEDPGVALARNVPRKHALEMLLTGEGIDAETALAYGLVNRVVPPAELDAEVARLARSILDKTPVAVAPGKRTFYQQVELGLEEAYALATDAMLRNLATEDAAEGIDAFVQKRPPRWQNQ